MFHEKRIQHLLEVHSDFPKALYFPKEYSLTMEPDQHPNQWVSTILSRGQSD
jgi:hypothetical protein